MRRTPLILCAAALLATSAQADITFGGNARIMAMGGAGLAVVDRSGNTTPINPAQIALLNRRAFVDLPSLGVRFRGVPFGTIFDRAFGGTNRTDATSLMRDFGSRNAEFGGQFNWGVRLGHLDARTNFVGTGRLLPNAALQTWVRNAGGDVNQLTGNERGDFLGAAIFSMPTVGWAERVSAPGSPTLVEVGARAKLMRAYYTHYVVDSNAIRTSGSAAPAAEMNGATSLRQDGLGVDLGFLIHPRNALGITGALVVTNLIAPNFRFTGTSTDGLNTPVSYDYQPRSIAMGTAWQGRNVLLAADLVDLTNAYGNTQLRLGAEWNLKRVALRAGYNAQNGFSYGFGLGFLQLSFGKRQPLEVMQTLRF
jgi:hypothetical protein